MAKGQKSDEEEKAATSLIADQVRGAVDTYFDYLKRTVAAAPSGGTVFGDALKGYAEKNISMTHDYVRRLSHAKDPHLDPDVEAVKKLIAVLEPQMDTAGKASLVEHCLALRDREEFRQQKVAARQHENVQPLGRHSKAVGN